MTSEPRSLREIRGIPYCGACCRFLEECTCLASDKEFRTELIRKDKVEALLRRRREKLSATHGHNIKNIDNFEEEWKEKTKACKYCHEIKVLKDLLGTTKKEEKIVIKDRRVGECSFCGSTIYESEGFCIMCNTDKNVLLDKDVEARGR